MGIDDWKKEQEDAGNVQILDHQIQDLILLIRTKSKRRERNINIR